MQPSKCHENSTFGLESGNTMDTPMRADFAALLAGPSALCWPAVSAMQFILAPCNNVVNHSKEQGKMRFHSRTTPWAWFGYILITLFFPCSVDWAAPPFVLPTEAEVRQRLAEYPDRADVWRSILQDRTDDESEAIRFLITHMPERDLLGLSPEYVLENVRLALKTRHQTSWQRAIPDAIFFNDVLPYAQIDEPRDPWRAEFHETLGPLVADCVSASEVAQTLNAKIFDLFKVKYSTRRKRANQSPKESREQGLASCTGLSILLADACRAVGVPARLAGIAEWPNKSGNHTWVEIWDGDWHFTGAAEHDPQGLDRAWFVPDAARANASKWEHSILAASFRPGTTYFPLVWDLKDQSVPGVNVTERYVPAAANPANSTEDGTSIPSEAEVSIRIWDRGRLARRQARVTIWPSTDPSAIRSGETRGDTSDMNDMLRCALRPNTPYLMTIDSVAWAPLCAFTTQETPDQLVEVEVDPPAENSVSEPLDAGTREKIARWFAEYFAAEDSARDDVAARTIPYSAWERSLADVRQCAWDAYLQSPSALARREDYLANRVTYQEHTSPYAVREVGTRGPHGWPLVIAMHGGGNAPQELNDSQWKVMQTYYHDHPEHGGYKYLALRAPNNTWNGFYDNYVYPLIENLIAQQVALGDVDPNRVFLIGYSHGGYGAFSIGPKLPFRFAAIHASAAAPTDGETAAANLFASRFTFMVGEHDEAYGRRERCLAFAEKLRTLRGDRIDTYPCELFDQKGYHHSGLPDRDWLANMTPLTRNPLPREVTWELTDPTVDDFYWLSVDHPDKGQWVKARLEPKSIHLSSSGVRGLTVWLDERLGLADGPVTVEHNGQSREISAVPSLVNLADSLLRREDIDLACFRRLDLSDAALANAEESLDAAPDPAIEAR